jgi:hypothetical protein
MKRKKPAEKNKTRPEKTKKRCRKAATKQTGEKAARPVKNRRFQVLKKYFKNFRKSIDIIA